MSSRELKIVEEFVNRIITNEKEREKLKRTLGLLENCEIFVEEQRTHWINDIHTPFNPASDEYKIDVTC